MKRKVVLDIDHTLLYSSELERGAHDAEFCCAGDTSTRHVWFRPGLKDFLEFVFKNFEVHLCSAATKVYVTKIVESFNLSEHTFKSIITKEDMKEEEVFDGHSYYKDFIKEWDDAIVIDDKDYVFRGTNLIILRVTPFFPTFDPAIVRDFELTRITKELTALLEIKEL